MTIASTSCSLPLDDTKSYIITSVTDNMTNYNRGEAARETGEVGEPTQEKPFESKKMATYVYQRTASPRVCSYIAKLPRKVVLLALALIKSLGIRSIPGEEYFITLSNSERREF